MLATRAVCEIQLRAETFEHCAPKVGGEQRIVITDDYSGQTSAFTHTNFTDEQVANVFRRCMFR